MNLRTIATPLTIAAFLGVGLTGICMVLDFKGGYVENFHELAGIAMVSAAALHLWVNRVSLAKHLRSWLGAGLVVLASGMVILAVAGPGKKESAGKGDVARKLAQTASRAELKRVAILAGKTPSQAVTELRAKGLVVESEQLTLEELAKRNRRPSFEILNMLLPEVAQGGDHDEDDHHD